MYTAPNEFPQSRDILDTTTGVFVPGLVNKDPPKTSIGSTAKVLMTFDIAIPVA